VFSCDGDAPLPDSGSSWMATRQCRISVVVLLLYCFIRASGIVESASPIARIDPNGRCHHQGCIRRHRRSGGRDWQRGLLNPEGLGPRVRGSSRPRREINRGSAPAIGAPNKRLHLTPRLGIGVGHFVTRGCSVSSNQKRFQNNSRFAAQVSREPLGGRCLTWNSQ
jgi:hypothetical protein